MSDKRVPFLRVLDGLGTAAAADRLQDIRKLPNERRVYTGVWGYSIDEATADLTVELQIGSRYVGLSAHANHGNTAAVNLLSDHLVLPEGSEARLTFAWANLSAGNKVFHVVNGYSIFMDGVG